MATHLHPFALFRVVFPSSAYCERMSLSQLHLTAAEQEGSGCSSMVNVQELKLD